MSNILRRMILSWFVGVLAVYAGLPIAKQNLSCVEVLKELSLFRTAAVAALTYAGLSLLARKKRSGSVRLERWAIVVVYALLAFLSVRASYTLPFLCCAVLIGVLLSIYAVRGWDGKCLTEGNIRDGDKKRRRDKTKWTAVRIAWICALLFFCLVACWTLCRVLAFAAPSYDFGIFSQMFYRMRTTGLPLTTLERDGLLSHFCVHVSPIYYLLLPFYCLWPRPETLQVLQAAVLASAALPLWKLAEKHGCTPAERTLFVLLLLLYPAYAGGAGYDLHENAFLTPLLFWLFYAVDCQKGAASLLVGLLVLSVKEDAAVYVATVALYLLLCSFLRGDRQRRWNCICGALLFAVSLCWFLLATWYLATFGDGVMTYRYNNFICDGSGSLLAVVKAALLCPMKVVFECVDAQKLPFMALTLLPLCALLFRTRRYERFVLLIPYVLVNLMSDYRYQHDVFFQYTYGSTACLFYLAVINHNDARVKSRRWAWLAASVVLSAFCFGRTVMDRSASCVQGYLEHAGQYRQVRELLAEVPEDASVAATTFYTVPLSMREVLYDVRYASREHLLSADYVALELADRGSYAPYAKKGNDEDGFENLLGLLEENGYQKWREIEGVGVIYKKQ